MNLEQARINMIEQQIRTWEVFDQRVLNLLEAVPREDFVPPRFRRLAYSDTQIPLDHGQVMMTPKVEARLLQSLSLQPSDNVLEVGTGSGYLTALLARSARHVTSIDIHPSLVADAERRLDRAGIANVSLASGDASHGWIALAPYDVIAVTGSVPLLEPHFQEQLAPGGRLFVIVGEGPAMDARLITRLDALNWASESLFETCIPPLVGAPAPSRFVF
jgi:protein-L-isoaspartate(D-aspartate) O-methyltransferase